MIDFKLDTIVPETKYCASDGAAFSTYEECAKYEIVKKLEDYIKVMYAPDITSGRFWLSLSMLLDDAELCEGLMEFHKFDEDKRRMTILTEMFAAETPPIKSLDDEIPF